VQQLRYDIVYGIGYDILTSVHLDIYTDGASRGNPGHSAIGAVIYNKSENTTIELSDYIGIGTNNNAEYIAVLTALKKARKLNAESVHIYLDSELIARQLTGKYKVKSPSLQQYFREIVKIIPSFKSFKVTHILRENNKEADRLANKALDSLLNS